MMAKLIPAMSLPTPPSTSHRDKENRLPPGSRISWSQHNQYHSLTNSPPGKQPSRPSGSRTPPPRSILKKSSHVLLPFEDDIESCQRETTPEPSDPLTDLSYLENPVANIVASGSSLRDLIEAYSVLTARLKAAVTGTTDADASWPLFQPLRKNRQAVVDALVRDLGRALVDPGAAEGECKEERVLLPSPKSSPPKRRHGMSAEQVKYARDLCTTCHAVIKMLAVMLTLPAIYRVFTDEQLDSILTQVLAIPMSDDLPTPNARKTCALSIWLLQNQRLPSEVLWPAKDRIAYALRRGIEGELGKEGKKGSVNDGLKAIHELAIFQPATFLPAFLPLMPSILSNLLAPTLALRTQASHALGGLVIGLISLPVTPITHTMHGRISETVSDFLTAPTSPTKSKLSSPSKDPVIIRTLRTTLQATDPQQAAQGPVWALTVLASLIVLLGSRLYTDLRLSKNITALLSLTMRHKKSSIRGLGCLVWRCFTWVWFQRPFADEDDGEGCEEKSQQTRETYWRVVKSCVDVGAGVATIAALLHDDTNMEDEDATFRRVLEVMKCMIKKGGQTCGEAMDILKNFVTFDPSVESDWTHNKLLPHSLFSALPGVLTAEYKSLVGAVKPIFEQCPQLEDVRALTREEVAKGWLFDELVEIWRKGLAHLELPEDCGTPVEVVDVWQGLISANVSLFQDADDEDSIVQFSVRAVNILIEILQDNNLDLTTKVGPPPKMLSSSSPPRHVALSTRSNAAIKLSVTCDLWGILSKIVPHNLLIRAAERLLIVLVDNEEELVWETDSVTDDARKQWAMFCAQILLVCDTEELVHFWDRRGADDSVPSWAQIVEIRGLVWTCFLQKWMEETHWDWERGVVLLSLPLIDKNAWELSNESFKAWDNFLQFTINKALDCGIDSCLVLDHVASSVAQNVNPAFTDSARIADMLLTRLEINDTRQIPRGLFQFVNDTLLATYPPEPRNKVPSSWLLRTLTRVIDSCPKDLLLNLIGIIQDGVSVWVSDSYIVFDVEEYEDEVVPLYQTILLGVQSLPRSISTLEKIAVIVESAFWGREDKPQTSRSFSIFWRSSYSSMDAPVNGWPEKIQICIRATASLDETNVIDPVLLAEDDVIYDADISVDHDNTTADDTLELPTSDDSDEALSFPESEDEEDVPAIHKPTSTDLKPSPVFGRLGPAVFTPLGCESNTKAIVPTGGEVFILPPFSVEHPPSTPAKTSVFTSTPPRPQKSTSDPPTFLTLPLRSPTTPLPATLRSARTTTPKFNPEVPASASRSSPSKRRKLFEIQDKENMSPRPIIASITERLAMRSPAVSVLGKRQAVNDWQEGTTPKKAKMLIGEGGSSFRYRSLFGGQDSDDERSVEQSLLPHGSDDIPKDISAPLDDPFTIDSDVGSSNTSDTDASGPESSSPLKRKRVHVELADTSVVDDIANKEWKSSTPPPKRVLRRTKSAITSSSGPSAVQSSAYRSLEKSVKKRSRRRSNDPFDLSPFRALEETNVIGSDDSIVWVSKTKTLPAPELSSDDDPHLGQVTPHHLISPALRRAQEISSDPASDDSIMSASPSHDLATRRRDRLASFSYLQSSTSMVLRSRAV